VIVARGLSAPLSQLAAAARRIARGDLSQRVPVKGSEEVADLSQAFNDMAASLQQAETLRRNMVADIAHELRAPLSVMQGNLQAILDDVYPLTKEEIAGIYGQSLVLTRLVNDLRELAQAEAGQLRLNIRPVPLGALISNVVDVFQEAAREREIQLAANLPPAEDLPPVSGDADRIRQVLQNLLTNALQYTPPGGQVCLAVNHDAVERLFHPSSAAAKTPFVRVSVSDTGPGIPAQDLPHVFDRFWRADKARSRDQGGSGLGLAIARQLVEAQGGQIGVESEGRPGRGSRFWFTLPVNTTAGR
jgi:two-component system OmpR family sensor kinase/two-component system sensor histidine kinase BaeS